MKIQIIAVSLVAILLSFSSFVVSAKSKKNIWPNNDPEVLYLENHTNIPINFLTIKKTNIYASKKGTISRKLGRFKAGSKVKLIAMNHNAYKISGKGKYGLLKGWVSPKSLANKDPKFSTKLLKIYKRQMKVNKLINNNEVAIGMSLNEVTKSVGKPTKQETIITKDGKSGKYDYIKYEKQKHYRIVVNPRTGYRYKQLSHITTDEKSKLTIEFTNNTVTSISLKEDNGQGKINTILPPIWGEL